MNTLAVWYNNESKKDQDQEKAKKLYLQAAQLGYVSSMQNLARVLDEPESHKWATVAFQNGGRDEDILPIAYQAYAEGIGVEKNAKIAAQVQQLIKRIESNDQAFRKALGIEDQ